MELLKKVKDNQLFLLFILLMIFLAYFIINRFAYFDAPSLCYISLKEDILSGNKKTMHQAIDLLKERGREDYKNLCRYVDTISEKYCLAFDARVEGNNESDRQPGCFVKGSRTIYIKPEEASNSIVEQRATAIKKFMLMSKSFWESQQ